MFVLMLILHESQDDSEYAWSRPGTCFSIYWSAADASPLVLGYVLVCVIFSSWFNKTSWWNGPTVLNVADCKIIIYLISIFHLIIVFSSGDGEEWTFCCCWYQGYTSLLQTHEPNILLLPRNKSDVRARRPLSWPSFNFLSALVELMPILWQLSRCIVGKAGNHKWVQRKINWGRKGYVQNKTMGGFSSSKYFSP